MATWDYHNFDNDAAADFAEDFRKRPNEAVLYEALATVAEEEGLIETAEASQALAAAELVAAIIGKPAADMPVGLLPATTQLDADGQEDLQELAIDAVEAVLRSSELQQRWAESADYQNWQALQQNLLARLQLDDEQ
jgi:rubrerythrin